MDYSLIVVNFNSATYVKQLLNSIFSISSGSDFEVIIVDNSSQHDLFLDVICEQVKYISAGGNVGFGRGCNVGASHAAGNTLLFVNPDIIIKEDIFIVLSKYREFLNDGHLIGFNLTDEFGQPSYSYGSFPSLMLELYELLFFHKFFKAAHQRYSLGNKFFGDASELIEVDYVCGALFAISKDQFLQIAGFDEDFFLYFEETELMWRLRHLHKKVYLFCKPMAVHIGSVTTNEDSDFKIKNMELGRALFYKKSLNESFVKRVLYYALRCSRLITISILNRRATYFSMIVPLYRVLFKP